MKVLAKSNEITLSEHTSDVLKAVRKLLELKDADENLKKLLELSVIFHDAGKIYPKFQSRVGNKVMEDCFKNFENLPNVPHSFLSIVFIPPSIDLDENDMKILFSAVAFHHWRNTFLDFLMGEKVEDLKRAFSWMYENRECLEKVIKEEIPEADFNERLCEYLSNASILESSLVLPPYMLATLPSYILDEISLEDELMKKYIFISGNLKRADRFTSFVEGFNPGDENSKVSIDEIEKVYRNDSFELITEKLSIYKNIWQKDVLKENRGKNIILIAPTGSGKTEFALMWSKGKTVLTLPLRSAVNSIFSRLEDYFGKDNVGLVHSDVDIVLFEKRYGSRYGDPELEGENHKVVSLSRFLSYPFIVSTADQIFPAVFKFPGYEMIYSTLMDSYLVIDEIQAYEPVAVAAIVKLAEEVSKLGGKVLVMTATLPNFVRRELEMRIKDIDFVDKYDEFGDKGRKIYEILLGNTSNMIDLAVEKYEEGKRVLIIRNTVNLAQTTYDELRRKLDDDRVFLIHSRMTMKDRKEIEEKLKQFAPGVKSDRAVLVGTQVVEASLNIDFDVLITDIAPADSLVQRFGRVYRKRDYGGNEPIIYVFVDFKKEGNRIENICGVYTESAVLTAAWWLYHRDLSGFKDNVKKSVPDLRKKMKKSSKIFSFTNSDLRKFVEDSYQKLEDLNEKYIKDFRKTLEILDSGYSVESRREAQDLFRRVMSVDIIPEKRLEKFKAELEKARSFLEIRKIISENVVPVFYFDKHVSSENLKSESIYVRSIDKSLEFLVLKGSDYRDGYGILFGKDNGSDGSDVFYL